MVKKGNNDSIINIAISAAVCGVTVFLFVFTVRMPYGNEIALIVLNGLVLSSGAVVISADRYVAKTLWRCAILTFTLSAAILALYIPFEKYGFFERLKDLGRLKNVILSTGNWGITIFFLITLASVIFLPVPASLIIVAGTLVYGSWISFGVSAVATFVGSVICFFLGRNLGKKLLYWLFERKKVDKYSEILGKKGKMPFITMMILPFFPDDMICISAGMTSMSFRFFAVSVAITRTIYIFVVSFLGSGEILPFRGIGIVVWVAIFAVCAILSWLINKKISDETKDSLSKRKNRTASVGRNNANVPGKGSK